MLSVLDRVSIDMHFSSPSRAWFDRPRKQLIGSRGGAEARRRGDAEMQKAAATLEASTRQGSITRKERRIRRECAAPGG